MYSRISMFNQSKLQQVVIDAIEFINADVKSHNPWEPETLFLMKYLIMPAATVDLIKSNGYKAISMENVKYFPNDGEVAITLHRRIVQLGDNANKGYTIRMPAEEFFKIAEQRKVLKP